VTVKVLDKTVFGFLLLYALASSTSIAVANIAVCSALIFAIVRHIKEPLVFQFDKRIVQVIFLFWFTILVSATFAYDHLSGFDKLWAYVYRTLPFFLAVPFINTRKKLVAILIAMALSILLADLYGIWQGLTGIRAQAFSSHWMIFGGFLEQMIPLLAILGLQEKSLTRSTRVAFFVITVLSLLALAFNATRGAWIGILVVFVLVVLLQLKNNVKTAIVLSVFAALLIGLLGSIPAIQQRAASVTDITFHTERILVWKGAWQMFLDHPIVGVGPGNFEKIYLERYILPDAKERLGHAHNNFLHILAENGIIGFAGFMAMFGYFLIYLYKNGIRKRDPLALAVLLASVALLVQGFSEFNYGDSAVIRLYWFLLGLAGANFCILKNSGELKPMIGEKKT